MKLNPLSNRVVIKFVEAEEKTKGGIVLTAAAQEKPQIAEVIAIGPGKVTDNGALAPMTVKVGDKVIASKYAGTAVKLDGTEYTLLSEDDILAIVE
jgi:chaperonin GroES